MATRFFFCSINTDDYPTHHARRDTISRKLEKKQSIRRVRFRDIFPEEGGEEGKGNHFEDKENRGITNSGDTCETLSYERRGIIKNKRVSELRSEAEKRDRRKRYRVSKVRINSLVTGSRRTFCAHEEEENTQHVFDHSFSLERPSDTVLRIRQRKVRGLRG